MASLTIDDLDDEVMQRLQARAARHGRSPAEEARALIAVKTLEKPAGETPDDAPVQSSDRRPTQGWDDDKERRLRRILALGRKPDWPFDQKAETDALWNFVE